MKKWNVWLFLVVAFGFGLAHAQCDECKSLANYAQTHANEMLASRAAAFAAEVNLGISINQIDNRIELQADGRPIHTFSSTGLTSKLAEKGFVKISCHDDNYDVTITRHKMAITSWPYYSFTLTQKGSDESLDTDNVYQLLEHNGSGNPEPAKFAYGVAQF